MKTFLFLMSLLYSTLFLSQNQFQKGIFVMEGGNYSIQAQLEAGKFTVVEPNRTTPYTLMSGNTYQYYHSGFNKTYYVEIVDNNTLNFTSSNTGNATVFHRESSASASDEVNTHYMEVANKYKKLAEDGADQEVQAWAFCSATALAGAMKTNKEYRDYAKQASQSLKLIIVNPNQNPCSDAIPDDIWNATGGNDN
ncbi:hypothetical protein [Kaistella montana]|uniref:Uncharacterized protein n=1 Tax=Kaistella montana TaxID=1849733 RepID=A0ABW5K8B9_9FLAO|nr:hypothetical protein [Kaistella montana]MCQ4035480.1 hypothetical protein [Kaistella montana]